MTADGARGACTGPACVVLGEQTLLTQCCEILLDRGYEIVCVVSDNPLVRQWCADRSIRVEGYPESLSALLGSESFDLLFSITNLRILPPDVLAMPARLAINFHDGPLPEYGGLNAPVWALLDGARHYGVSWHVMTESIDDGDLLAQETFPVAPDETAFGLNAKCYQAAIESFHDLLANLEDERIERTVQRVSADTYHGPGDRPADAATIDWSGTAVQIERLVRALDFGPMRNPVILPRLDLGTAHLLVRACEARPGTPDESPGTIVDAHESGLSVATVDGRLEITRLSALDGGAVSVSRTLASCALAVGDRLPEPDNGMRTELTRAVAAAARHEPFWVRQLRRTEPLEISHLHAVSEGNGDRCRLQLPVPHEVPGAELLVATVVLLLARTETRSDFSLAVRTMALDAVSPALARYIEPVVPWAVSYDPDLSFRQWCDVTARELERLESRLGLLTDLRAREPALQAVPACTDYPVLIERVSTPGGARAPGADRRAPLTIVVPEDAVSIALDYDERSVDAAAVRGFADRLAVLLDAVLDDLDAPLYGFPLLTPSERRRLEDWNAATVEYDRSLCIHQAFERQVAARSEEVACIHETGRLTYLELNERANRLARHLLDTRVTPGDSIGILLERTVEMPVSLLAVLKAGCSYVPLDPAYPEERLRQMVADSGVTTIVTEPGLADRLDGTGVRTVMPSRLEAELAALDGSDLGHERESSSLAYVIYTSGSTGRPKGVLVEHRSVLNFFAGMDQRLGTDRGTWLAVTSISFDISVLEMFWTLCRGFTVVLHSDRAARSRVAPAVAAHDAGGGESARSGGPEFGLFFWNVAGEASEHDRHKYRLLLDSARYADAHGFGAVWTPERHFSSFGGLFPNPSVTSAAIATITERVDIRAGSCVVPLHSPIRIAEEWAVVDNLSGGRVGMAMAAGWAAPDFAIKPENHADARNILFESAEIVQRLWRGDTVEFPGPEGKPVQVRTLPRPLQRELPLWITTAGNVANFVGAGKMGANLLTHLLGQSVEELTEKIAAYRAAWDEAGHVGRGTVTVMLHTFVGADPDTVEHTARQPMKDYLKSAMFLVKESAWQFPTFKKMSEEQGKTLDEFFETISDDDMDALLEFAFQRYFSNSGLFGTPESCMDMVERVDDADVDEIACLIDFGIDDDIVLENLPHLNELRERVVRRLGVGASVVARAPDVGAAPDEPEPPDLVESLLRHRVTHLQCTPSMANLLLADERAHQGLARLEHLMVGGEAFPPDLCERLSSLVGGRVTNMYGPTETTIWSSTGDVPEEVGKRVPIGRPLPNQQFHVLDARRQRLPVGVAGELYIAGEGVARGYHDRPSLTEEAFLPDPFSEREGARMYRTGDIARYLPDGRLECLGRVDQQVKVRGYRVEPGEVEAVLRRQHRVREAAVVLRGRGPDDRRLVAYVSAERDSAPDADALREYLRERLPEFMIPSTFVFLPTMPLMPSGKVDRSALASAEDAPAPARANGSGPPPTNGVARPDSDDDTRGMLRDIWARALDTRDVIDMHDNFFDIGGHSLLVIQVLNELSERVDRPVKLTDLFKHTTIESLAAFLDDEPGSGDERPLSPGRARVAARKAAMQRRRRPAAN